LRSCATVTVNVSYNKSSPQSYLNTLFALVLGFRTRFMPLIYQNDGNTFCRLFLLKWLFLWLQMLSVPLKAYFYEIHAAYRLALTQGCGSWRWNAPRKVLIWQKF